LQWNLTQVTVTSKTYSYDTGGMEAFTTEQLMPGLMAAEEEVQKRIDYLMQHQKLPLLSK
jgi:hypothetical protein